MELPQLLLSSLFPKGVTTKISDFWLKLEVSCMARGWTVFKEVLPDTIFGSHSLPAQSSKKDPSLLLPLLLQSLGGSVAWAYGAVFPAAFQSWAFFSFL